MSMGKYILRKEQRMAVRKRNNVIKLRTAGRGFRITEENKVTVIAVVLAAIVGLLLVFMPNAYKISINGEFIGAIKDKKVIEGAKETVITQLESQYGTSVMFEEELEIERYRAKKQDYIDQTYLISCMRKDMDILIGFKEIFVEGKSIGIVSSADEVEELKNQLKKKYYGNEDVEVEFGKKVEVKDVFAKESDLISMDKLVQKCTTTTPKSITYTVQPGDTLSGIASKYNTTIDGIISANEGFTTQTVLRLGQEINANINEPMLSLNIITKDATNSGEAAATSNTQMASSEEEKGDLAQ